MTYAFPVAPITLTVLATYQCTAACKECCFECSRSVTHSRIPGDRLIRYINDALDQLPTIEVVVFSGGECFLLGKDLDLAIEAAANRGKVTRCVSNGYWATSQAAARDRLAKLRQAGLAEINFSTGDDHQEFVPFERVVYAAVAAAELEMTTLIVVEGHENSRFRFEDAISHPIIKAFTESSPFAKHLKLMRNVWVGFHGEEYVQPEAKLPPPKGCDSVLTNVVITPHEMMASCCGLTMEHIPEMKVGDLREASFFDLHKRHTADLVKLWIYVDGTQRILAWCMEKDPTLQIQTNVTHPCQACAIIYGNDRIKAVIRQNRGELEPYVLHRLATKKAMAEMYKDGPLARLTDSRRAAE